MPPLQRSHSPPPPTVAGASGCSCSPAVYLKVSTALLALLMVAICTPSSQPGPPPSAHLLLSCLWCHHSSAFVSIISSLTMGGLSKPSCPNRPPPEVKEVAPTPPRSSPPPEVPFVFTIHPGQNGYNLRILFTFQNKLANGPT